MPAASRAIKAPSRKKRGSFFSSGRSDAIRPTRFWLLNDTYIDLVVPAEKIGVPFDNRSASSVSLLSDNEKAKIIAELSKCQPAVRAGSLEALELALEMCRRSNVPAPVWLLPYVLESINKLMRMNARARQKRMQREINQLRWAAVHHLRTSQRLTWEAAYEAACRELRPTRARGTEETIRASYKWMNRHPLIRSIRQCGLAGEIDAFAREQYENRQAASQRIISLELGGRQSRNVSQSSSGIRVRGGT
jgi:hypothetical protein